MKVLLISILLFSGCAGANRYYPKSQIWDCPCDSCVEDAIKASEYPNRPPRNYEINHLNRLREKGDKKEIRKYLKRLKQREG